VPFFAVAYTQPISVAHAELMFPKLPTDESYKWLYICQKDGQNAANSL
jgi:hypothetical protein